jgi:tetratricopeptide (TPR) repeat protein
MPDPAGLLREAQRLHTEGRIDEALALARDALRLDPGFVEAWLYYGTTLITRRLQFQPGLDALEKALALAPDDSNVHYSLGWCYEFVAYRLSRLATTPYRDPDDLFEIAMRHLRRVIEIGDDEGLSDDARDLLASIEARY